MGQLALNVHLVYLLLICAYSVLIILTVAVLAVCPVTNTITLLNALSVMIFIIWILPMEYVDFARHTFREQLGVEIRIHPSNAKMTIIPLSPTDII